jgi:hypothetical protein
MALTRYQATIGCNLQTIPLNQSFKAAFFNILFDLGLMIVVVAESLKNLGRGQVR